jgi:hypothetical protein
MKIGTLIVLGSLPYLDKIGELIVGWTKGNTALQIVFVMFVCSHIFMEQRLMVDFAFDLEYLAVFDCG